jgi:hypothetical protein
MRVEGLRELDALLADLPKATQRNVLKRVLREQARPLVERARAFAPYRFGDLRESITVTDRKPPGHDAGKTAFGRTLAAGGSQAEAAAALRAARRAYPNSFAEVFVGPGRHPQAITQEFGTWFHAAQPFLRPAWDSERNRLLSGVSAALMVEIDKAVARRAKRASKG